MIYNSEEIFSLLSGGKEEWRKERVKTKICYGNTQIYYPYGNEEKKEEKDRNQSKLSREELHFDSTLKKRKVERLTTERLHSN